MPLIALAAVLAFQAGCSQQSDMATPPPVPEGASPREVRGDFGRLVDDIPRAAGKLEWAVLHVRAYDDDRVHAEALMPNERTAVIDARRGDGDLIHVTVKVGAVGEDDVEARFINALRRTLREKPVEK